MAASVAAPPFCIELHLHKSCLSNAVSAPRTPLPRIPHRKSTHGSLRTRKMCKLGASTSLLKPKADLFCRQPSVKCICLASFADLDGIAALEWVPVGDQVLLMASIFLTYMAGVIPVRKSNYSSRKNVSEKNLDIGSPASSGSATENDSAGNLEGAWDVVKGKLTDSLDAIEHGSNLGSRVHQFEQLRGKPALSLYAIAERPKMWLLWTCFQQLEEEANNISATINMDDWMTTFPEIIRKSCKPACMAWLKQELCQENSDLYKAIASLMIGKLDEDDTILQRIRKSGKEDLYSEFFYFHVFGSLRKSSCYDPSLFHSHGISILEDLLITLADGLASIYLELISVDGNLSSETSSRGLDICNLSTRALQKLRNEVALYQWLYQNLEAVVSMYEDRFDMHTLQSQVIEKPGRDGTGRSGWWEKLAPGKSETFSSPLHYSVITHFSMPVKRTKELRALAGWKYYFSLFLELSDISMPIIRVVLDKISGAISFFLMTLIGRSLGLIYTGIRQSLRWK